MTKSFHDKHILKKSFTEGMKVWLFNACLRLFPGKLHSRWDGPYIITKIFSHGDIEIRNPRMRNVFKVNGQRLKPYVEGISQDIRDGATIEEVALIDHIYQN